MLRSQNQNQEKNLRHQTKPTSENSNEIPIPVSGMGVTDYFGYFRQLVIDDINDVAVEIDEL